MKKAFRLGLSLSCALGLAACGSKGSTGPSFSGTISNADAATAGENADGIAGDLVNTFDFGVGPSGILLSPKSSPKAVALLNFAWQAAGGRAPHFRIRGQMAPPLMPSSAAGCNGGNYTVVSGDTADADGDGIPNNETVTLSCDSTLAGGEVLSIHGTIHIQDVAGLYGYQFSVNLNETQTLADTSLSISVSGTDNAAFTAASIADNLNITESIVTKEGAVSVGGAFHENWDATFTATGGSIALGDPLPDGTIAFNGGFYVTDAADATQNFNFNLSTPTPLSFVASCYAADDVPPFDAGEINGSFNGSASVGFTVTYSACNTAPDIVGAGNAT